MQSDESFQFSLLWLQLGSFFISMKNSFFIVILSKRKQLLVTFDTAKTIKHA